MAIYFLLETRNLKFLDNKLVFFVSFCNLHDYLVLVFLIVYLLFILAFPWSFVEVSPRSLSWIFRIMILLVQCGKCFFNAVMLIEISICFF